MRVCDVCAARAPECRSFDAVIVGALKASGSLTASQQQSVLDQLKIKQSVVTPSPTYGDVCGACATALEKELAEAIDINSRQLTALLLLVAKKTLAKMPKENDNEREFARLTADFDRPSLEQQQRRGPLNFSRRIGV